MHNNKWKILNFKMHKAGALMEYKVVHNTINQVYLKNQQIPITRQVQKF